MNLLKVGLAALVVAFSASVLAQQQPNQPNPPNQPSQPVQPKKPVTTTGTQPVHVVGHVTPVYHVAGMQIFFVNPRRGYTLYGPGFSAHWFRFPFYESNVIDPSSVVVSPWYFYPNLPPYIDSSQLDSDSSTNDNSPVPAAVAPAGDPPATPDAQPVDQPTGFTDGQDAISQLRHAWLADDGATVDKLLPTSGTVEVSVGPASYTLEVGDFADLFHDGVDGTKTVDFTVQESDGTSTIHIRAEHDFSDPWGAKRAVMQTYTLVKESNGYVIRTFGSQPYQQQDSQGDSGR